MEFIKKQITNYTWKVKNVMQFTLDDTINISENLLDIERLVLVKGNVVIEEVTPMVDRFQIKGSLNYQILYMADEESNTFDSVSGKVPFVEYINADGTKETDYVEVHASLNDITVTMLHSRKLSLKALIGIDYQVKEKDEFMALTAIEDAGEAEVLEGTISMMSLKLQNKQPLSIVEDVDIPANKPDIYQVIWKNISVINPQIKACDGYLLVSGSFSIFLLYNAEEQDMPVQYFTMEVPFEKRVDEQMSSADMISGSALNLDQYHIAVIADDRGNDRKLEISADFTVEIKLYGQEDMKLVRDAYSTDVMIEPEWKEFSLLRLLMRNCAKIRVLETVEMPKKNSLLQVCYTEGMVSIDETKKTPQGISVTGVLAAQVIYLTKDENGSLASTTLDVPFDCEIEVAGMNKDVTYSIVPHIDQIQAVQLSDNSIEIKAEISLEVLAFSNENEKAVLNMAVKPIDSDAKLKLPGITCYIVKPGDTLWSIAKRYYTTVKRLREINGIENDTIYPGDKLIILKE